jgi:hypothetical protein
MEMEMEQPTRIYRKRRGLMAKNNNMVARCERCREHGGVSIVWLIVLRHFSRHAKTIFFLTCAHARRKARGEEELDG